MFQSFRHNPQDRLSAVWRRRFHEVDVKGLLTLECGVVEVNMMQTTVKLPKESIGMFPTRTISRGKTLLRVTIASYFILVFLNRSCLGKSMLRGL